MDGAADTASIKGEEGVTTVPLCTDPDVWGLCDAAHMHHDVASAKKVRQPLSCFKKQDLFVDCHSHYFCFVFPELAWSRIHWVITFTVGIKRRWSAILGSVVIWTAFGACFLASTCVRRVAKSWDIWNSVWGWVYTVWQLFSHTKLQVRWALPMNQR